MYVRGSWLVSGATSPRSAVSLSTGASPSRYNAAVSSDTLQKKIDATPVTDAQLYKQKSFDPSKRAEALLDSVLGGDLSDAVIEKKLKSIAIEDAKRGSKVVHHDSGRTKSRVLFVTEQKEYLEADSTAQNKLRLQALLFDEVHVLVLTDSVKHQTTIRIADNAWVYKTGHPHWWGKSNQAVQFVADELMFANSFRPDIVVALDPLWSGLVALAIAREFDRRLQVHVTEDYFSASYQTKTEYYRWHRRLLKYILKRADSICVSTEKLKTSLSDKVKKLPPRKVLPHFHNFTGLMKAQPVSNFHDIYKQFVFIMVAFLPLKADSPLQDVFTAFHEILRNPRIGLIVVGEGPARALYEEKAELLGIKKNVVFLSHCADMASCLKTADILVQTDVSKESEDIVLQAAAAGLPLLMYETELRLDLFKDGESATLCTPGDTFSLTKEMSNFLNNPALRVQYAEAAQYMVSTRLHEDETSYYQAYRDIIELGIITE